MLSSDSPEPNCWWATYDVIASSHYNLAASQYKPAIINPAPKEYPDQLISEAMEIEKKLQLGLEKMLMELEVH